MKLQMLNHPFPFNLSPFNLKKSSQGLFGKSLLVLLATLGLSTFSHAAPLTLANLPLTINGVSGGTQTTESCGSIPATPHLELNLDRASYLQAMAETMGDATLWIDGPLDFCVLRDATTNQLSTAGHWPEGLYRIYVGDRKGQNVDFTLTVSP